MVVSLGMVLIGGTILLFTLAFNKMQDDIREDASEKVHLPKAYRNCGDHSVSIADNAELNDIEFDGVVVKLISDAADGTTKITQVHGCTGEVLGTLTIQSIQD